MSDSYMKEQGEALAAHLRLNDGKSGYVEVTAEGFHVHVRKKFTGQQCAGGSGAGAGGRTGGPRPASRPPSGCRRRASTSTCARSSPASSSPNGTGCR